MAIGPLLARGRAAAEARMTDTCTIRRVSGSTTDPETGVITPTYATIYTGRCRIAQRSAGGGPSDVGEASIVLQQLELHLPVAVVGVDTDDTAAVTASTYDPDLVGRVFVVRGRAHGSQNTARRWSVTEVTG